MSGVNFIRRGPYCYVFLMFILSCISQNNISFNKEEWKNEKSPLSNSFKRKSMIKDLKENYLKKELCLDEILELLGSPAKHEESQKGFHKIQYLIDEKYESLNTEPVKLEFLEISLNKDKCFDSSEIVSKRIN